MENMTEKQKIRWEKEAESLKKNLKLRQKQQAERQMLKNTKKDSETTEK